MTTDMWLTINTAGQGRGIFHDLTRPAMHNILAAADNVSEGARDYSPLFWLIVVVIVIIIVLALRRFTRR